MTVPVCTFRSAPKVRPDTWTFCELVPVLVITTSKCLRWPGLPVACNWPVDLSSVSPVGAGEPAAVEIDLASWTAR